MTVLKADAALNDFQELPVFLRKLFNILMLFRKVHLKQSPDFKGVDDFLRWLSTTDIPSRLVLPTSQVTILWQKEASS